MSMALLLLPLASLMAAEGRPRADWLVAPVKLHAALEQNASRTELVLSNGLVSRTLRVAPNACSIDYRNLVTGPGLVRGVKPEAVLVLDGQRVEVGGLVGQPDYAYLAKTWLEEMTSSPDAFHFVGYSEKKPEPRYEWKPKRHAPEAP